MPDPVRWDRWVYVVGYGFARSQGAGQPFRPVDLSGDGPITPDKRMVRDELNRADRVRAAADALADYVCQNGSCSCGAQDALDAYRAATESATSPEPTNNDTTKGP